MTPCDGGGLKALDDLELAREELLAGDDTVVIAAAGRILARAGGGGLMPLLDALDRVEDRDELAVADRVVGLAAALFLAEKARAVYGGVMSSPARRCLQRAGVTLRVGEEVGAIENRRGDGLCPLESIALEEDDPSRARERILGFVGRLE